MPKIVIVQKSGDLKEVELKEPINYKELYKKCGFRKAEGFDHIGTWDDNKVEDIRYDILLYGRRVGKGGTENKYDYPPPEDNTLFFGDTLLLAKSNDKVIDLTVDIWLKIYEELFGGFEDLDDTAKDDELEVDELENIPDNMKTKTGGYLKDGFVVDDSNEDDTDEEDSNSSDSFSDDTDSELEAEKYEYSSEEN